MKLAIKLNLYLLGRVQKEPWMDAVIEDLESETAMAS